MEIKGNKAINAEIGCKRREIRGNESRQGRLLGSQADSQMRNFISDRARVHIRPLLFHHSI